MFRCSSSVFGFFLVRVRCSFASSVFGFFGDRVRCSSSSEFWFGKFFEFAGVREPPQVRHFIAPCGTTVPRKMHNR